MTSTAVKSIVDTYAIYRNVPIPASTDAHTLFKIAQGTPGTPGTPGTLGTTDAPSGTPKMKIGSEEFYVTKDIVSDFIGGIVNKKGLYGSIRVVNTCKGTWEVYDELSNKLDTLYEIKNKPAFENVVSSLNINPADQSQVYFAKCVVDAFGDECKKNNFDKITTKKLDSKQGYVNGAILLTMLKWPLDKDGKFDETVDAAKLGYNVSAGFIGNIVNAVNANIALVKNIVDKYKGAQRKSGTGVYLVGHPLAMMYAATGMRIPLVNKLGGASNKCVADALQFQLDTLEKALAAQNKQLSSNTKGAIKAKIQEIRDMDTELAKLKEALDKSTQVANNIDEISKDPKNVLTQFTDFIIGDPTTGKSTGTLDASNAQGLTTEINKLPANLLRRHKTIGQVVLALTHAGMVAQKL